MPVGASVYPCPHCGKRATSVIDSRFRGGSKLRRRKCRDCGARWGTIEVDTDLGLSLRRLIRRFERIRGDLMSVEMMLDKIETPIVVELDDDDVMDD